MLVREVNIEPLDCRKSSKQFILANSPSCLMWVDISGIDEPLDLVNRLPLLVAGLQGHSGHVHPLVCVPQLVLHSPQAASEFNIDVALVFL